MGQRGFSLMDVLIAVAIVGILTTIAVPSYQSAVRKSNRAAAEAHLMDIAQRQQQFVLDQRSYAADLSTLVVTTPSDVAGHYTISIDPLPPATPPTFTARATPIAGSSQAADLSGQPLTISSTGTKGPSGAW
jgi:type IV pilus assembly protein PilE